MATTLILIRHGKPQTGEGANRTDPPLSTEGETATRRVAMHLNQQGHKPDLILCSPLLRAKQSAEIVAKVHYAPIEEIEALGGSFDQDALIAKLPPTDQDKTVYMVGHDPTLTLFAHNLIGQKLLPAGLSKSGSVVITFNSTVGLGKGHMVAYYHPERI